MKNFRLQGVKLNIFFSLFHQAVALVCGLIIPGLMIRTFGSEAYGATTSIGRFLSYISLMEGGMWSVSAAALYSPLAEQDTLKISEVVAETKRFYRMIGYFFVGYTLLLACTYQYIAGADNFSWFFLFGLVIAISISTLAQYFVGISYSILVESAQKAYIGKGISIVTVILNTVMMLVLIHLHCNLILVKLVSSIVFLLQPFCMWLYVKKHFSLVPCDTGGKNILTQKWDGVGQHIAYFLYFQTDIAVLTIFTNLSLVAVYSVYNIIISYMQNFISSFTAGMTALFGDMIAKEERDSLHRSFQYYETMLSMIAVLLFSVTAVMIVSFVELYTTGITDANYREPFFALLLVLASMLYCLRLPYQELVVAAGHFRQTNHGSYAEAILNITLSVLFLRGWGICGVAAATVIATSVRFLYYVWYLSKNILCRRKHLFCKRALVNAGCFFLAYFCGKRLLLCGDIGDYFAWACFGFAVTLLAGSIVLAGNLIFYKAEVFALLKKAVERR